MSRGRKAARDRKYADSFMRKVDPGFGSAEVGGEYIRKAPRAPLRYEPTCPFCHVRVGSWHEDDCLYRGPVKKEHVS